MKLVPARDAALLRLFQHGGDINSARTAFPEATEPWIDLSTGVNPVPYPPPALAPEIWTGLPAPGDLEALQAAAGRRYGVAADCVAAAPGAQSLIQWLPRLFAAAGVAILSPTYGGHETAWRTAGADVAAVESLDALAQARAVVVNPNNPDGRLYSREQILALAERMPAGGLLVVDESFMDLERQSVAPDLPAGAIVLRSLGKVYGLAGVRLGFALARPELAAHLRRALGSWPVSGAAIAIGRAALEDEAWLEQTRHRLGADAAWLDARLRQCGLEIVGGTKLFRLARHGRAPRLFEALCREGVLTRPFAARPEWLRFGVPKLSDRPRVASALAAASAVS